MRYSGSKRRFMKELRPILMKHVKENTLFVDAFGGGMNVICDIPHNRKCAVELNRYVYSLWIHIRDCITKNNKTIDELIPKELTEEKYYEIKKSYIDKDGRFPDWLIGYVGSALSYGGGWFAGYAKFNHKKNENHILEAFNGLKKQVENFYFLEKTNFVNCSYDEMIYPPNSVIYCDPPYADTKKYETDFNHEIFWEWVRKMSKQGHYVYVSEYNAPSDFKCIWQKKKKDGMSMTKKGKKQNIKIEKLFIYNNG